MQKDHKGSGRALPQTALREVTDRTLLAETIRQGRTTRAELADATGYSRPTVSEAVRRLVSAGLLDPAGPKETGRRGRIGTFYSLGARAGWVLGLQVDQSGVHWQAADLAGAALSSGSRPPAADLSASLRAAVTSATGGGPLRAVGVSIANPVDPATHDTVPLDGTPFPEGLVNPAAMIADLVTAPVLVDNDVNLAALAEHRAAGAGSFAYVYIGAGLGVGLYIEGNLIRGAHGLAGEIGYLPGKTAPTLAADLTGPDSAANDVASLLAALDAADPQAEQLAQTVARAVTSVAAVVDPELVLLGGPVGTHPALLPRVRELVATTFPGRTRIDHGSLGAHAPLQGALHLATARALATAVEKLE